MLNNPDLKYQNSPQFGTQSVPLANNGNGGQQANYAPNMQGNLPDTYVPSRVKKINYEWVGVPAGVGIWLAICKGMDYFNNILTSKDYKDTPFGKIGEFGDKVSNKYFDSAFAKSSVGKSFHGFLGKTKDFVNDKIIAKSKVLTALKTHSTTPENNMVKAQYKGLLGLHNMEIDSLLPSFLEGSEVPQQLERYGMKQDAIDKLKNSLKGKSKEERLALLEKEEFKLFKVNNADALKEAKIKALGFKDAKQYEKISKSFLNHPDEVMQALQNADKNMYITRCSGEGFMGKVQKFLFNRKVTFKELANKYLVIGDKTPHKTKLGRGMAKGLAWLMEGMTNRFAGGKMIAIMQSAMIAEALVATLKADGIKDKAQTFIERNVNTFSYVFSAPLALMLYHKAGGLKYTGMSADEVKDFRAKLEVFNEKAKNGGFKTKEEYKTAKKELDTLLKGNVKNPLVKGLKKIGEFLTVGIEKYRPYKSSADKNMNWGRKAWYWAKEGAGYPLRIGLIMFALMPLVSKVATQASNAIFGKPKVSVLDEENEDSANNEVIQKQLEVLRQDAYQRQQASAQYPKSIDGPRMNLLDKYKQGQRTTSTTINNTTINTNISNQNQSNNQKRNEPLRTYIPSPVGVQVANPQMNLPKDALERSMQAEQEALKVLSMH